MVVVAVPEVLIFVVPVIVLTAPLMDVPAAVTAMLPPLMSTPAESTSIPLVAAALAMVLVVAIRLLDALLVPPDRVVLLSVIVNHFDQLFNKETVPAVTLESEFMVSPPPSAFSAVIAEPLTLNVLPPKVVPLKVVNVPVLPDNVPAPVMLYPLALRFWLR